MLISCGLASCISTTAPPNYYFLTLELMASLRTSPAKTNRERVPLSWPTIKPQNRLEEKYMIIALSHYVGGWFVAIAKTNWYMFERLKAGEGDDRGWDGWMALPTQWTCLSKLWEMVKDREVWYITKSRAQLKDWTTTCILAVWLGASWLTSLSFLFYPWTGHNTDFAHEG